MTNLGFFVIEENPSSKPPKKHNQLQNPLPIARDEPTHSVTKNAKLACPSIKDPGKIITLLIAAGIIVIGSASGQKL